MNLSEFIDIFRNYYFYYIDNFHYRRALPSVSVMLVRKAPSRPVSAAFRAVSFLPLRLCKLRITHQGWSRSISVPGSPALSSNSIISYSTVRCCSIFSARPKGCPSGQGTNTARGGRSPAVISLTMLTDTVAMPSRSTAF